MKKLAIHLFLMVLTTLFVSSAPCSEAICTGKIKHPEATPMNDAPLQLQPPFDPMNILAFKFI